MAFFSGVPFTQKIVLCSFDSCVLSLQILFLFSLPVLTVFQQLNKRLRDDYENSDQTLQWLIFGDSVHFLLRTFCFTLFNHCVLHFFNV